jgi:hypothetical protein
MQRDCDCDPSRKRCEEYPFGPLAHEYEEFAFSLSRLEEQKGVAGEMGME